MSRLLHTSDWHLGCALDGRSREEDFDAVLAEIVEIAQECEPDLIVHSGDLFHSSHPGYRELLRAVRVLGELAAIAPTVVVAGNHDSPGYFEFLDHVSGPSWGRGLFFVDQFRRAHDGGVMTFNACGGEQRIRLAVLPFVHANRFWARSSLFGTTYADYAEGMRGLQAELAAALHDDYDPGRDVLLFAAHIFVAGATPAHSEREVDIDQAYAIPPEDLPAVSYAALGHIHAPQNVPGVPYPAHYAGSPLQIDFGEAHEHKSVVIVDAEPGRRARPTPRRLTQGRQLAQFKGTLELLQTLAPQYDGTFLKAVITDEEPDPLLSRRVAEIVPGATLIKALPAPEAPTGAVLETAPADEPELPDALRAYLAGKGISGSAAESTVAAFAQLLAEIDDETPPAVPAEEMLRAALEHTRTEAS